MSCPTCATRAPHRPTARVGRPALSTRRASPSKVDTGLSVGNRKVAGHGRNGAVDVVLDDDGGHVEIGRKNRNSAPSALCSAAAQTVALATPRKEIAMSSHVAGTTATGSPRLDAMRGQGGGDALALLGECPIPDGRAVGRQQRRGVGGSQWPSAGSARRRCCRTPRSSAGKHNLAHAITPETRLRHGRVRSVVAKRSLVDVGGRSMIETWTSPAGESATTNPASSSPRSGITTTATLGLARKLISAAVTAAANAVKFQKRTVDVVYTADESSARVRARSERRTASSSAVGARRGSVCGHRRVLPHARTSCGSRPAGKRHRSTSSSSSTRRATRSRQLRSPTMLSCATTGSTADPSSCRRNERARRNRQPSKSSARKTSSSPRDMQHLVPVTTGRTQPPGDRDALSERYGVPVGYSGHEVGLSTSVAARALGALHDRAPHHPRPCDVGVRPGRLGRASGFSVCPGTSEVVESALGDGVKVLYDSEIPIQQKHGGSALIASPL